MGSLKTIQHSTHVHPLTQFNSDREFLCNGCRTLGDGKSYRCQFCNFNLHERCATCPLELSCFMHEHRLKLVSKSEALNLMDQVMKKLCDLCGDPVEGLFYECNQLCGFNVHPLCTQLPAYVNHVKDKAHRLRLQRCLTEDSCTICRNECSPWRYRCEICCLDLHLECVLATCEEAMSSTPASRALNSPLPPPAASNSPFFNAYYPYYGYGANPGPPYYGYGGVPLAPPYVTPYSYPHHYGVNCVQPQFHPYAHSHSYPHWPYIPPPPYNLPHGNYINYGGVPTAPQNYYAGAHGGNEFPSSSNYSGEYNDNSQVQHSNSQVQGGSGRFRKKMYAIIGSLALGVTSNALFGTISSCI
ncbi:C1-like protein [Corchorus olitorius]|uniref:C1-like protein n=1 Tax=Corchorus olitorius TaxID=93759 RepID=A0A1R3HL79_9ROSI|nr:C1-like protein [Corchorus olitorius]